MVFISHVSEEAQIAATLKRHIESVFSGQCKVFISSDPRDIPAGSKWLEKISQAIEAAKVLVVLCSPASLKRPWINFEMGCGWVRGVPIIPVCHSGQTKGQLPPPISTFQALELDSTTFVAEFFDGIAGHLQVEKVPKIDEGKTKGELMAALKPHRSAAAPESEEVLTVPSPGPVEELDDKSRAILEAIAHMGDAGLTAEDLAGHLGISRPKMEYYLENLARGGHISYQQEIVDDPPVARLEQKGRGYLIQRGLL